MKYILTDVEGTTTSISFVHDVLFPFAKERLRTFVNDNNELPEVQACLLQTKKTSLEEDGKSIDDEEAINLLLHWISIDRKHAALKNLQGLIWEKGYQSGEIRGHVYPDVPTALRKWKNQGIEIGVYSSGSIKAQHLIFEFSTEGNLRPYFSHHFDTSSGHKREVASYHNIASSLGLLTSDILFLSDIKEELDAAKQAGMQTNQLVRQDDVKIGDHARVIDFSEIKI